MASNDYRLFAIKDNEGNEKYATFTCDIHEAVVAVTQDHKTLGIEWCHALCTRQEVDRLQKLGIPCFVIAVSEIVGGADKFQIDRS